MTIWKIEERQNHLGGDGEYTVTWTDYATSRRRAERYVESMLTGRIASGRLLPNPRGLAVQDLWRATTSELPGTRELRWGLTHWCLTPYETI